MNLNDDVKWLFKHFNDHGFLLYLIGGAVRNHLLNIPYDDYDFTTSATPNQIISLLSDYKLDTFQEKIGSIKLHLNNKIYEITSMRVESGIVDIRYPSKITFVDDLKLDVKRRDFTVNALAYHPDKGIIDYLDGVNDLKNKCIKFINDPRISINEDPIRLIRGLRFSLTLGFIVDDNDYKVMQQESYRVSTLGKIRFDELEKICLLPGSKEHLLKHFDIYKMAYPEFDTELFRKILLSNIQSQNLKYALLFISNKSIGFNKNKEDLMILSGLNDHNLTCCDLYHTKLLYNKYHELLNIIFDVLEVFDDNIYEFKKHLLTIKKEKHCLTIKDLEVTYIDLKQLGIPVNLYSTYLNELLDIVLRDHLLNKKEILLKLIKEKKSMNLFK